MARRFHLEHPDNEDVIAKCGFDEEHGFVVDVFVGDQPAASFSDRDVVRALDFLAARGFFTTTDLEGAHHVIFDDASRPMPEGTKRAFETVINFLRVRAG